MADGESVRDLIPEDETIRLIEIEEGFRIGDKRNFGCSVASGDLVAHWDDDDYSAPDRLSDQISRLSETGRAVTGYNRMRFTDGIDWWEYRSVGVMAVGTSLMYRRDWWKTHPFKAIQVGEDVEFIEVARVAKEIVSVPAEQMMYATIHQKNTSPRNRGGDGPYYPINA